MRRKGFTLIELVVIIAIIGILAAIGIPRYQDSQASARGAKIVAELRMIDSAITLYVSRVGSYPTSLDQLTEEDPSATPPKLSLLVVDPEPDGSDFIVRQLAGGEKRFQVAAATPYSISGGRATYDGNTKTVEWYLNGNGLNDVLASIREWESSNSYPTGVDPYWRQAYADFTASGLTQQLTAAELQELFGSQYNFTDGLYRWQSAANKGTLFLRSATAVMMDGSVGNIQMLVPNASDTHDYGAYSAAGFIVDGVAYLRETGNVVNSNVSFGNGSVYLALNAGGSVQITNAVQAIQYLKRPDVSDNWSSPAEQIAWLKGALVQAGYTEVHY